jgi:hypothetical protein
MHEMLFAGLGGMLEDVFLEFLNIGAGEAIDLLRLLDEHECRHRGNVVLNGEILALVNINLEYMKWREEIIIG